MEKPAKADFFVASEGNDSWSGKRPGPNAAGTDGPFASLARARNAVRSARAKNPDQDFLVLIRGGLYRLTQTVAFGLEDSAAAGHSITYAAFPGEVPVFSSGVPIRGWHKLEQALPGLPGSASGKVWAAEVSSFKALKEKAAGKKLDGGAWRFLTLYNGKRRLPRARTRGFSPTNTFRRGQRDDHQTFRFPKGALKSWPDLAGAEIVVVPCYFWTLNILPLESVDEESQTARTTVPATYAIARNGMADRDSAWVENIIEALDEPGEWVLDSRNEKLYLWPEGEKPSPDTVAPLLTEHIRVEGKIDDDGPEDIPVRGLVFRGLTFTHGDRLPWHGRTGLGLQHDWEQFDKPTALVRFRGAENCTVEDCQFAHSSHTAVRLDLHCRKNRISGNRIEHMGGAGILLAGYGPGTKNVNRQNELSNNYIHHIGEIYWGLAGIFAWQSGENRIAHNLIHHVPYTGIVVSGRIIWDPKGIGECSKTVRWKETGVEHGGRWVRLSWQEREKFLHGRRNRVEFNDIHHAMEALGDGNCIYISGTGTGNEVRGNYCHDCDGKYMNAAIRCDDDQHGTTIEGNVICRTRGYGEGVISKGKNDILNNFIVDLRPQQHHRGYIVFPYLSPRGSRIQRNILYSRRTGQILYAQNRGRKGQEVPRLRDTEADYNLYYCTEDPNWAAAHLRTERGYGIEAHSLSADPMFADIDRGDFRFRLGSPAPGLGIQPIDVPLAGLEPPYRERFVGKTFRTRIRPSGCEFVRPVTITLETDRKPAEIHYTIDGSEPTKQSPDYTGPFELKKSCLLRARSFAEGATDLVGASAVFTGPPPPLLEDFESVGPGETTPGATTSEENETFTARVTDEQAASGKHSLKFIDGPGQKYAFNPHIFYRTRFRSGTMRGRFAARIDAKTRFYCQWRDYGTRYHAGPTVEIHEGGKLVHNGKKLLVLPLQQWLRFEVTCILGKKKTGTFDLKVQLPGEARPRKFSALKYDPEFTKLDWLGFVPNGGKSTVIYLDDLELRPVD